MRKIVFLLIPFVFIISNTLKINAQWLDATAQDHPYVANDFAFFQSRTGVSFNNNVQNKPDYRRTTDGGLTWTALSINGISPLNLVSAVNNTTGFAAGQQLAKTTDAGYTWDSVPNVSFVGLTRSQIVFQKLVFASATTGFATLAATGKIIYKTTDGGKSWTTADRASGVVTALYALNTTYIYAIINDTSLEYTNDGGGGTEWKKVSASAFNSTYLSNVCFKNAHDGYVTGSSGTLFHTADGGSTWNKINMDTTVDLLGMQFLDSANAVISGASEVCFSTSDSGKTWHHHYQKDPSRSFLYNITKAYYFDKNNGAALGNSATNNALLYIKDLNAAIQDANIHTLNFDIYPNPSTGLININNESMPCNGLLTVYNSTGKVVFKENMERNFPQTLSLSAYGKGFYIIKIANSTAVGYHQVIIE